MATRKRTFIDKVAGYYNEPPITTLITIWWIFLGCLGIILWYSSEGFKLNSLWDSMWWIFWTFISTLTLIFVAYSYHTQKEAFVLQKVELEATRKEFEEQTNTLKKDNFENTFFKLTEKQSNLIEYFQWWDKRWYDSLYSIEDRFSQDGFFQAKHTPPITEYIKNYIKINEVIINLIESTFDNFEDRFMYYDILNSLQSEIIKKMIKWYYTQTWEMKYLQLIESNS